MPDLRGRTLRDALAALAPLAIAVKVTGKGRVVASRRRPPGETLDGQAGVRLTLARRREMTCRGTRYPSRLLIDALPERRVIGAAAGVRQRPDRRLAEGGAGRLLRGGAGLQAGRAPLRARGGGARRRASW